LPELPDIDPFAYIIDLLMEVGPVELSWSDLEAWNRMTRMDLDEWELRTIHRLASVYTRSSREYDDSKSISPFVPETPTAKIESKIRDSLRQPIGGRGMKGK
tara:strand:+ start:38556 stop:38861 length:306 start_codon:yes stop_codon:yes gene_type:complete